MLGLTRRCSIPFDAGQDLLGKGDRHQRGLHDGAALAEFGAGQELQNLVHLALERLAQETIGLVQNQEVDVGEDVRESGPYLVIAPFQLHLLDGVEAERRVNLPCSVQHRQQPPLERSIDLILPLVAAKDIHESSWSRHEHVHTGSGQLEAGELLHLVLYGDPVVDGHYRHALSCGR